MWRRLLQPRILVAVAVAGAALAACSSGRQSLRRGAPQAASSTLPEASVSPTPASIPVATFPLTAPTVAAITTKVPYAGTTVSFTMSPISGPIGTRVRVSGNGFIGAAGDEARTHSYFFALIGHTAGPTCELVAQSVNPTISIDASGDMAGSFSIPSRGSCFQQSGTELALPVGPYMIALGVHSDLVAQFAVTK